ncbi:alanine racemase [Alkalihalobacillus sp. LMS39]|uniref:alanine racemase n=1 Tax=Alkalihalobacillus sp. LMS39 TaxID=2924032 RepID=UPI001FB4E568|nr:alanine racemase [Alkalihalobacillus sp. LMS39]UOE94360.1 alanine racemase [Alkalihalobacillus sp. LMS39]
MENVPKYYRDTWVEVNLDCIEENIKNIKSIFKQDMNVMAVVKADGYGHGAVEVAKTALHAGAAYLAVAILDEAIMLRKAGIDAPILVLGYIRPEDVIIAVQYQITVTATSRAWVENVQSVYKGTEQILVHLKFDTGMGRIGITTEEEGNDVIEIIKRSDRFLIEGVFTHFATADELTFDYFEKQYDRFLRVLAIFNKHEISIPYIHCGNSATGLRFPDRAFNMFRLGISMYGLTPSIEIKNQLPVLLKEAFSLHSRFTQVKHVPPGEGISYGATYQTKDWEWIGTIPIGYADGWYRYHSTNGGHVLVDGKKAPFVGRICMDQCMVRLPYEVKEGTEVTLIGRQQAESISIDDIAMRFATINYEVPCMIGQRVPRVYIRNNQIVSIKNKVLL